MNVPLSQSQSSQQPAKSQSKSNGKGKERDIIDLTGDDDDTPPTTQPRRAADKEDAPAQLWVDLYEPTSEVCAPSSSAIGPHRIGRKSSLFTSERWKTCAAGLGKLCQGGTSTECVDFARQHDDCSKLMNTLANIGSNRTRWHRKDDHHPPLIARARF